MSDASKSRSEILDAIHSSRGVEHINRSRQRSFSLNIFHMNSQELIEITRRVNDPDEGLRLMYLHNREAGEQTHREFARRVHNFVAASLTLVEHTRNFMREHYNETPIFAQYQAKIDTELASDTLVRFVQDLRNYMLHKGLPNSEMYLNFESNPDPSEGGVMETGIRIRSAPLLEWDRWSPPARRLIEGAGEFIDILSVAEAYSDKIGAFHSWLQGELDQLHRVDLEELSALQELMNQSDASAALPPSSTGEPQGEAEELEVDFAFTSARTALLNAGALSVFAKIRKIDWPAKRDDGFPSERPPGATITDKEMIGTPVMWGNDVAGRRVFAFAYKGTDAFGLDEESFAEVETLVGSIQKSAWARRTLSRSFIEKAVVNWLQSRVASDETSDLSEAIVAAARDKVQPLTLWAPVAYLEVQSSFVVGPVEVATVTKALIDGKETEALTSSPQQRESIKVLFNRLRSRMQGLAAVVVKMDAEPEKIKEDGEAIARVVLGLLRFFSPAAYQFPLVCASALLGAELVPSSNLLVFGDESFAYSESMLFPGSSPVWRISNGELRNIRAGLDLAGALVLPEGLSAFALVVRSSLLLFGTGTTFPSPTERLSYTLSSLEALLLRHSAERVEFNVAERMGLLLAQDKAGRETIARNVREAYRLRARQDISPLAPHEMGAVATFLRHAHQVIGTALSNVERFGTVPDFVYAVEQRKSAQSAPSEE